MKFNKVLVLAGTLFIAGFHTATAQTAEEVVKKHLDAIGGEANWKKVNTMKMVGAMTAQGTEIGFTITRVHGKAVKNEIAVMGMNGYQIITTKEGWSYMPFQGQKAPEAMTADDVKDGQDELDVQGELVDYKAKGSKIAFLGKDDMEGTPCLKLKLTDKAGKEKTMYFDATSYYLLKKVAKVKANGKEVESVETFANYQKLPEGIFVPMVMGQDGGEITFKSVEINKPVDDKIFKPNN